MLAERTAPAGARMGTEGQFRMHDAGICSWRCILCLLVAGWCGAVMAAETPEEPDTTKAATEQAKTNAQDATEAAKKKDADGLGLDAARWRIELTGSTAYHSGHHSRSGDLGLRSNVDYEIPVLKHMTVAPRIIPLMYYNEGGDGHNTLWIFGFGVVLRGYSNGEEQRGWYGEGGLHLLAQTGRFEGNSGAFNFMEEVGFGYMFKNGVHAAIKVNHISNAGLADHNAGINNIGLGLGYSFGK